MLVAKLCYMIEGQPVERPLDADEFTIGRSPQMRLIVPESVPGISRHHATIQKRSEAWWLVDNASRNGAYVNQQRVTESELHDTDVLHLGPFELRFYAPTQAPGVVERRTVGTAARVEFADDDLAQVSQSINLTNWQTTKALDVAAPLPLFSSPPKAVSSGPTHGRQLADQAWAIELFSEIGRALQVCTDLDEMFEDLLNLLLAHVPAERVFAGLLDPNTGEVLPRVTRSTAEAPEKIFEISRTILRSAIDSQTALLVEHAAADDRFQNAQSIQRMAICSAICVPLYHDGKVVGVVYLDTRDKEVPLNGRHLEIATAMALFTAVAVEQFRLRERALTEQRLRQSLARYSSPSVVERILQERDSGNMIADKEIVTVLFSDLKGFTSLSEKASPAEVVEVLNAVFTRLTDAVFRQQGTLDKFMGDGLLAFFGAPLRLPDHPLRAVRAAWEMLAAIADFNRTRPNAEPIGIRIGINTGPAIVGDIGSLTRKDYTVIGDTVNVASRFESSVAGTNEIVIGPATFEAVRHEFVCEPLEPVCLKGKCELVQAFRVVAEKP